jgi:putative heme transporter
VFVATRWLRNLGRTSWLLVGIAAVVVGVTWMLGIASSIVGPLLVALILGAVTSPVVDWLHRHRFPRAAGAGIVLLGLVAIAVVVILLVVGGISAHSGQIGDQAQAAADHLNSWLTSVGVSSSGADKTTSNLESNVPNLISTFTHGLAQGISTLTSLAFFLSFSAFCTFFVLKDAPTITRWMEHHVGLPLPVATMTSGIIGSSLRRYFLGTTFVGTFNAVVVGLGAWLLGVPLAGTIAVVTLVTSYVPFIGAFVAGAFAVVLALGAKGTTTALIMLVIVILANGFLQNIFSPIAMGATLQLNPLLILVVTISAGSFFGMPGMVLAGPITSAALRISSGLADMRAEKRSDGAPVAPPQPSG